MLKKFYFGLFVFLSAALFSQRDKDESGSDPVFKSAFEKYEQKLYKESYEEYTIYLHKFPDHQAALYNRGLCSY